MLKYEENQGIRAINRVENYPCLRMVKFLKKNKKTL